MDPKIEQKCSDLLKQKEERSMKSILDRIHEKISAKLASPSNKSRTSLTPSPTVRKSARLQQKRDSEKRNQGQLVVSEEKSLPNLLTRLKLLAPAYPELAFEINYLAETVEFMERLELCLSKPMHALIEAIFTAAQLHQEQERKTAVSIGKTARERSTPDLSAEDSAKGRLNRCSSLPNMTKPTGKQPKKRDN